MQIDLSHYKVHMKTIQSMLKNREYENPNEIVSDMAVATQCPVIVCLYYTAHLTSMSPQIVQSIQIVKDFYQIKEIKGWPLD